MSLNINHFDGIIQLDEAIRKKIFQIRSVLTFVLNVFIVMRRIFLANKWFHLFWP